LFSGPIFQKLSEVKLCFTKRDVLEIVEAERFKFYALLACKLRFLLIVLVITYHITYSNILFDSGHKYP